jgi:hypothetical protein
MRTTVTIDDDLLRRAREEALNTGRTLGEVIEDALRLAFARAADTSREKVHLPTDPGDGRGLRPGVDIDDSAALLDLMESRNAAL